MATAQAQAQLEIVELDDAGKVTATFVESKSSQRDGKARVDVILPEGSKSYTQQLLDVFLPAGYPGSVTEDYIHYQIYDSLQAFSSSIAGLLSSRAVLEGVGVGDSTASPTAALLLNVVQESMGRVATILFAHKLGTALEPECKMYRLAADVFNDTAMILDCLSPAFPKTVRVGILAGSSILRSLCGVCANSSKASLSAHFAKRGNLGEVNAKDSSQETVISLLGMLAGSVVVSWVSTPIATWSTLIALLAIHLAMNYAAVTAVSMHTLNRQRLNIVVSHYHSRHSVSSAGTVLGPTSVSKQERIFERDGILRWSDDRIIGHCSIGVSLDRLLQGLQMSEKQRNKQTGSQEFDMRAIKLSELMRVYAEEAYILWATSQPASQRCEVVIVLKQGCTPIDQLRAWSHALLLAQRLRGEEASEAAEIKHQSEKDDSADFVLADLRITLEETRRMFDDNGLVDDLREQGWDLDIAALETSAGSRVAMSSQSKKS